MTSNRDTILTQWKDAKAKLDVYQATERALRSQVIEAFSNEPEDASGVENVDVGWGYTLKITHKLDYNLDNANDYEATDNALDEIEKLENGELLAERLVKRKLEISVSEYKKLPPAAKKIIDRVLTIKPASKRVELVPPKGGAKSAN